MRVRRWLVLGQSFYFTPLHVFGVPHRLFNVGLSCPLWQPRSEPVSSYHPQDVQALKYSPTPHARLFMRTRLSFPRPPPQKKNRAVAYFASIGLSPPPSPTSSEAESSSTAATGQNPADYLLSLLAASSSSSAPSSSSRPTTMGGGGGGGGRGRRRPLSGAADTGIGSVVGINAGATGGDPPFSAGGASGVSGISGVARDDEDVEDEELGYSSSSGGEGEGEGDRDGSSSRPGVTPAELSRAYFESAASVGIREGLAREAAEAAEAGTSGGGGRWRLREAGAVWRGGPNRKGSTMWLSYVLTHRQVCNVWRCVWVGRTRGVRV